MLLELNFSCAQLWGRQLQLCQWHVQLGTTFINTTSSFSGYSFAVGQLDFGSNKTLWMYNSMWVNLERATTRLHLSYNFGIQKDNYVRSRHNFNPLTTLSDTTFWSTNTTYLYSLTTTSWYETTSTTWGDNLPSKNYNFGWDTTFETAPWISRWTTEIQTPPVPSIAWSCSKLYYMAWSNHEHQF
jgi:hypothetical protein